MKTIDKGWNLENTYLKLPDMFYTKMKLNPVISPELIILNQGLAESLALDLEDLKSKEAIDIFAGNNVPQGSIPISQAYAGHQYGHFTMLGDGRAMLIGEQLTPCGERFDIQLKGSGRTPYSRGGDGRAALGPMLREYIISEAMYNLGIPTTRSLAVVTTGEKILRQGQLDGAILTRVASSHIRVGTFEYAANWGGVDATKDLADYTINRHFPDIKEDENPYLSLLNEMIKVQASTICKWQLVGFVHGVMNTDNMTISGETIDYGPCAFMDHYDPKTVFSSIDRYGRYAYGNQASIGKWNLSRFAETLLPLIHENREEEIKLAEDSLRNFDKLYNDNWLNGMKSKLGIFNKEADDEKLIKDLLDLMEKYKADYTNTFVGLTLNKFDDEDLFKSKEFKTWKDKWEERLNRQEESKDSSIELMESTNPLVIPRNHQVEKALEAAVERGDYTVLHGLLDVLSNPYDSSKVDKEYMCPPEPTAIPYVTYCGT